MLARLRKSKVRGSQQACPHLFELHMMSLTEAIDRGARLYNMMLDDNQQAVSITQYSQAPASSHFLDINDLKQNKYNRIDARIELEAGGGGPGQGCFFRMNTEPDLVFDARWKEEGGQNPWVRHRYDEEIEVGIHEIHDIAEFSQIINPRDGIITAIDNQTVHGKRQERKIADDYDHDAAKCKTEVPAEILERVVPRLKHWSDVAFLRRKTIVPDGTPLKFILRHHIGNIGTSKVADRVQESLLRDEREWPGHDYAASTEEGTALLGTPNGLGVAWLLIQHKEQLGHKIVYKIRVFKDKGHLMILFFIVDASKIDWAT